MVGTAIGGAQGDAGQVEHGQHVGVKLLVGQAKADDIKLVGGVARLQAKERDLVAAHNRFKIGPGAVDPFGEQCFAAVDQIIEHHQAEVRTAQFIDIGKGQADFGLNRAIVPGFGDTVEFTAGVAGRFFHLVKHTVEGAGNLFGALQHLFGSLYFALTQHKNRHGSACRGFPLLCNRSIHRSTKAVSYGLGGIRTRIGVFTDCTD